MKPLYFNCHSGRDFLTSIRTRSLLIGVIRNRKEWIPIYHETHRGRILYSAPIAKVLLMPRPNSNLRLIFRIDCAVHESLLGDQEATAAQALSRTGTYSRPHRSIQKATSKWPACTGVESAVKAHFAWWDKVVEANALKANHLLFNGVRRLITCRPCLYTRQPVANQWEINVYMKDVLRKRYSWCVV